MPTVAAVSSAAVVEDTSAAVVAVVRLEPLEPPAVQAEVVVWQGGSDCT